MDELHSAKLLWLI
ncbi:hypothetical protein F383_19779 [Gossypium arboreum]|nr:hypothetical protein F383_19779 [Gossypium arboreum]